MNLVSFGLYNKHVDRCLSERFLLKRITTESKNFTRSALLYCNTCNRAQSEYQDKDVSKFDQALAQTLDTIESKIAYIEVCEISRKEDND